MMTPTLIKALARLRRKIVKEEVFRVGDAVYSYTTPHPDYPPDS
jgi:hypothetical protein